MTYKLAAFFILLWATLGLITAVYELNSDVGSVPGAGENVLGFVNRAGRAEEIQVDQPTVGTGGNPISVGISYANLAKDWLVFMGRAALLQSSIWEPWTAPIRWPIAIMGLVFLFIVAKEMLSSITNFIGGIFGRATP